MAHNLVYFDSSTSSIQKFSNAQLDDLAERWMVVDQKIKNRSPIDSARFKIVKKHCPKRNLRNKKGS